MIGIGIDIGSTAAKAAVVDGEGSVAWTCVQPTGFSSVDAAERLREALAAAGYDVTAEDARVIATGYGRVAVPYAHKVVTEITCHGTGAVRLFGDHGTVIDVGGQDTKVIQLKGGRVAKFAMNDKCAAGTGRFLEIMADRLGISQQQMADLARSGEPTKMTLILRGGAYGESLEASLAPFEAEHNVDIEVMLMSFDDLHTGIALDAVNDELVF